MNWKRIQTIKEWSKLEIYCEVQIFLKFVNFYKRFIYHYFKIIALLTSLFKNSENEKKSSFKWSNEVEQTFFQLKDIFMSISLFTHYDFLKRNRVKIDAFSFVVANILSQQNKNNNWRSMTFWSRKMTLVQQNYETYDQELLILVAAFK